MSFCTSSHMGGRCFVHQAGIVCSEKTSRQVQATYSRNIFLRLSSPLLVIRQPHKPSEESNHDRAHNDCAPVRLLDVAQERCAAGHGCSLSASRRSIMACCSAVKLIDSRDICPAIASASSSL